MSAASAGAVKKRWLFSLLAISALGGCNQSPYDMAPVHGTVTIGERLIKSGKVMFAPIAKGEDLNAGKPGFGLIRSDGTYVLTTYEENDGAVVGQHWVTYINSDEREFKGVPEFFQITAPEPYTVEAGKDNRIDVKVTVDHVKQYRMDDK